MCAKLLTPYLSFIFFVLSLSHCYLSVVTSRDMASQVNLSVDDFDTFVDSDGIKNEVKSFIWKNSLVQVKMIDYGATVVSIKYADKKGIDGDIILGFDDMIGYQSKDNPYMGATVGRVANRINNASFELEGQLYKIGTKHNGFSLHGGIKGFDKTIWNYHIEENTVIFTYLSKDMEEGFPGDVLVTLKCYLTPDNKFYIIYTAQSTKPTIINLTNHAYFNLAGHDTGREELYKHIIQVNSNHITETNENSIPTGNLINTTGTAFDLQTPKPINAIMTALPGLDDNFCVNGYTEGKHEILFVARLCHRESGRVMEVYSNQPGVQIYTSNHFPDNRNGKSDSVLVGKNSKNYFIHGAICFESQNYPDAIHQPNFPSSVLNPGETYQQTTYWKFDIQQ